MLWIDYKKQKPPVNTLFWYYSKDTDPMPFLAFSVDFNKMLIIDYFCALNIKKDSFYFDFRENTNTPPDFWAEFMPPPNFVNYLEKYNLRLNE